MILTELKPPDLTALTTQYTERTEGLHLSRITHDILCNIDPKRYTEREGGPNYMNFLMGLMYERALEMAWMDMERRTRPGLIRPGELMLDGIIGTPDAYDTYVGVPEEYKCTKKSIRQPITDRKFMHYWWQLKAYAKMMGVTSGHLWVLFINGDYSKDYDDPKASYTIKGWRADWSQLEIDENWDFIVKHAVRRGWL